MQDSLLNIKAIRQRRGMTQQELAKHLGITQARISEYEMGIKAPTVHRLPLIARALGVEVGELFTAVSPLVEHNEQVHG